MGSLINDIMQVGMRAAGHYLDLRREFKKNFSVTDWMDGLALRKSYNGPELKLLPTKTRLSIRLLNLRLQNKLSLCLK